MVTPPHSPLPWTVNEAGDIIDARRVPVIAEDGAILPEDRDYIIAIVEERLRKALEWLAEAEQAYRTAHVVAADAIDQQARDLAAARRESVESISKSVHEEVVRLYEEKLSAARRDNASLLAAAKEAAAQLAAARALSAQPDPHKEADDGHQK